MLLKLLGEATTADVVTVRIGQENPVQGASGDVGRGQWLRQPGRHVRHPRCARPHPHGLPLDHGVGPRRSPLRRPVPLRRMTRDTMSTDYYEILGVSRDAITGADQEGLPPAGDEAAPRRRPPSPTRRTGSRRSPRRTRCCRTRRSATSTTAAATRSAAGWAAVQRRLRRAAASTSPTSSTRCSAARPPAGPRSRVRRGQDALVRLDLELAEAAFGTTKPLRVDTAVLCPRCNGSGAAEGSKPVTCSTCHGQGDVTHVQRSFIGDIRTTQPCPTCRGYGTVIPNPCPECSGDGRVRSTPDDQRQDPGRGEHRQPDPPGRARRGRLRRRPGR